MLCFLFCQGDCDVKLQGTSWVLLLSSRPFETQGSGEGEEVGGLNSPCFSYVIRQYGRSYWSFKKVPQFRGMEVKNRALKINKMVQIPCRGDNQTRNSWKAPFLLCMEPEPQQHSRNCLMPEERKRKSSKRRQTLATFILWIQGQS